MTDSERRIRRACHTAREAVAGGDALKDVRMPRFHRAMSALSPEEGQEVHRRLETEPWFADSEAAQRKLRFA
jgi:hypothetical protein